MIVRDLFFLFAGLFPLLSIISLRAGDMLAASRIGNVGQAGGRGVRGSRGGQVKLEDSAGASNPKRAKKQRPNLSNQTCYNCNGNFLSFSVPLVSHAPLLDLGHMSYNCTKPKRKRN